MCAARIDTAKLLLSMQKQLTMKLRSIRRLVQHPTAKGNVAEEEWRDLLRNFLPKRYRVEQGFVLDSKGQLSEQIDVIIFDCQYSPLLFQGAGLFYVPAESVYAILEVKQTMDSNILFYAGRKAASVRRLARTSVKIPHAGGKYAPKRLYDIPAGLLCLESSWRPPFGHAFLAALGKLRKLDRLHFGCCLRHGGFSATYRGTGKPKVRTSADDTALIFFLLSLFSYLQHLGTAPAIDVWAYAGSVNRKEATSGNRRRKA